jgi:maltose O-acetyltransferase
MLNAQLGMRGVPLSTRLTGRARIKGKVIFGQGITFIGTIVPVDLLAHPGARIEIGDHSFINYGVAIEARELVSIGRDCALGHYVRIMDNNQHDLMFHEALPPSAPVTLEDHVWIGSHSLILPGVRIGHHAVIGAGSVVTRHIRPCSVAVGNPARIIRDQLPSQIFVRR